MRIISLFLIIVFLENTALCQQIEKPIPDEVPSKKQMQNQIADAKRQALQQLADLEKDIALAKVNNEDPGHIKEMEDQLATMKKILGVLDQAASAGDARPKELPVSKKNISKYKSPFVPVLLSKPASRPSEAQAKDQLFWYIGKKIDATTLITTTGMLIRHDRTNNRLIVQPEKRVDTPDYYYGLINTLSATPKMKTDFVINMDGVENSFFMFPETLKAYEEFDLLSKRYYQMAKNTIDLPFVPIEYLNADLDQMHGLLLALQRQLITKMENLPPITEESLPDVPERPHNLCSCDSIPRIAFEERILLWPSELYKEELELWNMIVDMSNKMEHFIKLGGKPILNWNAVIFKAKSLKIERQSQKLLELMGHYVVTKNVYKADAVASAATQLMANSSNFQAILEGDAALLLKARDRVGDAYDLLFWQNIFEDFIKDQKVQRNYNAVFDYSLYTSYEYLKKTFDEGYNVPKNLFEKWIVKLRKFNRFKLDINMDFEYEQEDLEYPDQLLLYANGTLESKQMITSLGRFGCKWQLYNAEVNHKSRVVSATREDSFRISLKVLSGTKIIYHPHPPNTTLYYSRPSHMQMIYPSIRIGFCDQSPDSVILDVLSYSAKDLKAHSNANFSKEYSTDMLFFANKMFLGNIKTKMNADEVIGTVGKVLNLQGSIPLPPSTGNSILDQAMMAYYMELERHKIRSEQSALTHTGETVIPFYIDNGARTFNIPPHNSVDPNDEDQKVGIKLKTGSIIVKIVHDPLP